MRSDFSDRLEGKLSYAFLHRKPGEESQKPCLPCCCLQSSSHPPKKYIYIIIIRKNRCTCSTKPPRVVSTTIVVSTFTATTLDQLKLQKLNTQILRNIMVFNLYKDNQLHGNHMDFIYKISWASTCTMTNQIHSNYVDFTESYECTYLEHLEHFKLTQLRV